MTNEVLSPKQLADEGWVKYKLGDYLSAARVFNAAAKGFTSTGEMLSAAEMANNCSVALLKHGDAQGALDAVGGTEGIFTEAGDILRQAMAAGNRGAALDELGLLEEAMAAYRESATLFKQAGEHELRAHVMQSLSKIQLRKGQHLQAFATMYAGVEGIERPNPRQKFLTALMRIPLRFLRGS